MSMSEYDKRQADWKTREDGRTVKVGEVSGRATGHIKITDDVKVRVDNVETLRFKPSIDIKNGDSIRITIEKI
ncbi:MAG: hypothetical protein PHY28_07710 [Dehalococcoidales bacterium]|nr:hypothetical protein [Dehalococcoidales bacterium]